MLHDLVARVFPGDERLAIERQRGSIERGQQARRAQWLGDRRPVLARIG